MTHWQSTKPYLAVNAEQDSKRLNQANRVMPIKQIQRMGEEHYRKAMKYVYNKKQAFEEGQREKKEKEEELDPECTFKPKLRNNKYMQKVMRNTVVSKKPRHEELVKFGKNRNEDRRQRIIEDGAKKLNHSLQRISQERARSKSPQQIRQMHQRMDKKVKTQAIPGVKKFYLKQVKGLVARQHETLFYKGDQRTGYYFK